MQRELLNVWVSFCLSLCMYVSLCLIPAQARTTTHAKPDQRRIALVIGNEHYESAPLANPTNDARAMRRVLQSRGFEVTLLQDVTQQRMAQALTDFDRKLKAGGIGLFYFAGHGAQIAGKTVLMPVDVDRHFPAQLLTKGIDLNAVLAHMAQPRLGKLNIVILDACLENPFGSSSMTSNNNLFAAPAQTLIGYAAAPGSPAFDGIRHGMYTAALLQAMTSANDDIEQIFQRAAFTVSKASKQQQRPWMAATLHQPSEAFALADTHSNSSRIATGPVDTTTRTRAILPKDSAEQYELTFWDSIKDSNYIGDFEAYLQAYPHGRFAALAKARIERLRAAAPQTATPKKEESKKTPAPAPSPAPPTAAKPQATPQKPPQPAPAASPATASKGNEIKDCPTCPPLIALRPGSFTMGSNTGDPSEKPAHHVSITTPFAIGKTEVTVEQWNACVAAGACAALSSANGAGNTPARDISWDEAQKYVQWLEKTTGKPYRLPTEAEWEYAARGGTSSRYWWGEQMKTGNANCKDCGQPWNAKSPTPVASFAPNPYGLYDMNGSVWEWVSDCWHNSYKGAPADDHAWNMPNCQERVIRGGSWREGASYMPSSTRFKYAASVRDSQNGFRVVREMK